MKKFKCDNCNKHFVEFNAESLSAGSVDFCDKCAFRGKARP